MRLLLLALLVAPVVLAQQPRAAAGARDAGAAPDAGTRLQGADAGTPLPEGAGEVERLRREVAELRGRLAEVERRQARTEALEAALERLAERVEKVEGQAAQLGQAEERRAGAERAVAEQRAATSAASSNLTAVLSQLSLGDTRGLEPSLRHAEQVFTGAAQRLVQLARQALANGDLHNARTYLSLALLEANAPPR